MSFRPSVWLFSGWNCVPAMLSRAIIAAGTALAAEPGIGADKIRLWGEAGGEPGLSLPAMVRHRGRRSSERVWLNHPTRWLVKGVSFARNELLWTRAYDQTQTHL